MPRDRSPACRGVPRRNSTRTAEQLASLAFGIPPIRPLSISPAACASRHAAAAVSSPMGSSMDGGVTGRAEVAWAARGSLGM